MSLGCQLHTLEGSLDLTAVSLPYQMEEANHELMFFFISLNMCELILNFIVTTHHTTHVRNYWSCFKAEPIMFIIGSLKKTVVKSVLLYCYTNLLFCSSLASILLAICCPVAMIIGRYLLSLYLPATEDEDHNDEDEQHKHKAETCTNDDGHLCL